MSEPKWTPGPHKAGLDLPEVSNNNPSKNLIWSNSLCIGHTKTDWVSEETSNANAQLFATATKLYDKLSRIEYWLMTHGFQKDPVVKRMIVQIDELLAEARGEIV